MLSSNLNTIPALNLAASTNSSPILMEHVIIAGIQAVISGAAPLGTLTLEASCDPGRNQTGTDVTNFVTVASSSFSVNGSGVFIWNLADIGYKWIRIVYTRTSGTGSAAIELQTKGA